MREKSRQAAIKVLEKLYPGICRTQPPEKLLHRLESYPIVSFDLFDTLLLRRVQKPRDVFTLVGKSLRYGEFRPMRVRAEQLAREEAFFQTGCREVTLEEIYRHLPLPSRILPEDAMKAEMQAERECCFADPFFLGVWRELCRKGKTLVVTTDMYLPGSFLQELMKGCGYSEPDYLFVSGEHRLSKWQGDLFPLIKARLGSPEALVHIGDTLVSDVLRPQKYGIKGLYAPRRRAAANGNKNDDHGG